MDFNLMSAGPVKFFMFMMLVISLECAYQLRKEK